MKLKTTMNEYSGINRYLRVNESLTEAEAYSYQWWKFVATDSAGNVFFQNHTYSSNTSKHQGEASSLLDRLGIKVSLTIHHTSMSLEGRGSMYSYHDNHKLGRGIGAALKSEIQALEKLNDSLFEATEKKGSWKKTNAERIFNINQNLYRIKDIQNIIDNYLDKKLIPIQSDKKESLSKLYKRPQYKTRYCDYDKKRVTHYTYNSAKERIKRFNSYKKYFRKPNGKLKRNEFQLFLNEVNHYNSAPNSIDKIKTLLKLNSNDSLIPLMKYRFTSDIERMIPSDIDSKEYIQLTKHLKRLGITKEGLNTLSLDKIHTYQINKLNRKEYTPSEPNWFPLSETLKALQGTKHLRLIKSDRQLRAEGRSQGHCIGGKHYIEGCYQGNQALNYKGYTFLLDSQNKIKETSGKHNTSTPQNLIDELEKLILGATIKNISPQGEKRLNELMIQAA